MLLIKKFSIKCSNDCIKDDFTTWLTTNKLTLLFFTLLPFIKFLFGILMCTFNVNLYKAKYFFNCLFLLPKNRKKAFLCFFLYKLITAIWCFYCVNMYKVSAIIGGLSILANSALILKLFTWKMNVFCYIQKYQTNFYLNYQMLQNFKIWNLIESRIKQNLYFVMTCHIK